MKIPSRRIFFYRSLSVRPPIFESGHCIRKRRQNSHRQSNARSENGPKSPSDGRRSAPGPPAPPKIHSKNYRPMMVQSPTTTTFGNRRNYFDLSSQFRFVLISNCIVDFVDSKSAAAKWDWFSSNAPEARSWILESSSSNVPTSKPPTAAAIGGILANTKIWILKISGKSNLTQSFSNYGPKHQIMVLRVKYWP